MRQDPVGFPNPISKMTGNKKIHRQPPFRHPAQSMVAVSFVSFFGLVVSFMVLMCVMVREAQMTTFFTKFDLSKKITALHLVDFMKLN